MLTAGATIVRNPCGCTTAAAPGPIPINPPSTSPDVSESVPAITVVGPAYEFDPDKVSVATPSFTSAHPAAPVMGPEIVAGTGPAAMAAVVITRGALPRSIAPLKVSVLPPRIAKLLATTTGFRIVRAPPDAVIDGSAAPIRPAVPIVKVPVPIGPERIVVPELIELVPRFNVPVSRRVPPMYVLVLVSVTLL